MHKKEYVAMRIDKRVHNRLRAYCNNSELGLSWFVERAVTDAIDNERVVDWAKAFAKSQNKEPVPAVPSDNPMSKPIESPISMGVFFPDSEVDIGTIIDV